MKPTPYICSTGGDHDWYQQPTKTDSGNTTSDRCHRCRICVINHWDGSRTFYSGLLCILRVAAPVVPVPAMDDAGVPPL